MTYFLPEKIRVDIGPSVQFKDMFGATHTVKRFAVVSASFSGEEMPNLAIDEVVIMDVRKDYAIVKVGGEYMMDFPLTEIARAACHGRVHRNLVLGSWVWVLHAGRYSLRHESDLLRLGVKEVGPKKAAVSRPSLRLSDLVVGERYLFGSRAGFYLGLVHMNPQRSVAGYHLSDRVWARAGDRDGMGVVWLHPLDGGPLDPKISPASKSARAELPNLTGSSPFWYDSRSRYQQRVLAIEWQNAFTREIVAKQEEASRA